MEETEIGPPEVCVGCIFQQLIDGVSSCRFYPKYKKIPFPLAHSPTAKPAFCRIKKIVVYEEPAKAIWGEPDSRD